MLISKSKVRKYDTPILNILLRSKVIAGTKTREDFKDNKGNVITIESEKLLNKSAFIFYAKCIQLVNYKNSKDIEIDAKSLMIFLGCSQHNKYKPLLQIKEYLSPYLGVSVKINTKNDAPTFNLMEKFEFDKSKKIVIIKFSEAFVEASNSGWIRFFDLEMYASLTHSAGRCLMRYIESKTNDKYDNSLTNTFKRSEICDLFGYNINDVANISEENNDNTKKQPATIYRVNKAIVATLDELKSVNFIDRYQLKKTSSHREDPMYIITVVGKKLRTLEKDLEAAKRNDEYKKALNKAKKAAAKAVNEYKAVQDRSQDDDQIDNLPF